MERKFYTLLFTLLLTIGNSWATIYYVNQNVVTSGAGTSWDNAFETLQEALDVVQIGDEVWVAAGTYYPTRPFDGVSANDRDKSFVLKKDVKIYGGFFGVETLLDERNWEAHRTILSGDIDLPDNPVDNTYHVVICVGDVGAACLDGFTITGGYASGSGGAVVEGSTLNAWRNNGGGIYLLTTSPTLTNLTIINNYAGSAGGGILCYGNSFPILTNIVISGNSAINGGGLQNTTSNPVLTNVVISGNQSRGTHAENNGGGGIFNDNSSPELTNVTISGNISVNNKGAGIYNYSSSSPVLYNTIVMGNTSGIGKRDASAFNPTYEYCLIQNENIGGTNINGIGVNYNDVFVGPLDISSITSPSVAGDYHLKAGSPAIDEGNILLWEVPGYAAGSRSLLDLIGFSSMNEALDLTGVPRIYPSTKVDIGAYESGWYEVRYDANGKGPTPRVKGVVPGGTTDAPTTALPKYTNPKHRFDWYDDPVSGEKIDFPMTVTKDTLLIAKWIRVYDVNFDPQNSSAPYIVETDENTPVIEPTTPTRADHLFDGWRDIYNNTWDFSTVITQDTTLTAKWIRLYPANITSQPQSIGLCIGSNHTLSVATTGNYLSYQWYKNDQPIAGAISDTYVITNAQKSDSASYHIVVQGLIGAAAVSEKAVVGVFIPPKIVTNLVDTTFFASPAELKIETTGDVLSYQWYHNGKAISGAVSDNISIRDDGYGDYHVIVTGVCNVVKSHTAFITFYYVLPIINRKVTLLQTAGVATSPSAGEYYVESREDFVFEMWPEKGYIFDNVKVTNDNGFDVIIEPASLSPDLSQGEEVSPERMLVTVKRINATTTITIEGAVESNSMVGEVPVQDSKPKVWSYGNRAYFNLPSPSEVSIYSISGLLYDRRYLPAGNTTLQLPSGFYIIQLPDNMRNKIIIK